MNAGAKKGPAKSSRTSTSAPRSALKPAIEPAGNTNKKSLEHEVQSVLKWLKSHSTKATLDGMARYAIPSDNAFGVAYKDMKMLGKLLGRNHELAAALWDTGVYEARTVASFVADPSRVTPAQMDRWCRSFDNWAICDTMCFNLFDRTPHAWAKVARWSSSEDEFVKRTAFALLWSLSVHDKRAGNEPFVEGLALIEQAAGDERNFVKKAVNMALRAIGKRNRALNAAAVEVARRLGGSTNAAARWVGKDALREITSPSVTRRLVPKTAIEAGRVQRTRAQQAGRPEGNIKRSKREKKAPAKNI